MPARFLRLFCTAALLAALGACPGTPPDTPKPPPASQPTTQPTSQPAKRTIDDLLAKRVTAGDGSKLSIAPMSKKGSAKPGAFKDVTAAATTPPWPTRPSRSRG